MLPYHRILIKGMYIGGFIGFMFGYLLSSIVNKIKKSK